MLRKRTENFLVLHIPGVRAVLDGAAKTESPIDNDALTWESEWRELCRQGVVRSNPEVVSFHIWGILSLNPSWTNNSRRAGGRAGHLRL